MTTDALPRPPQPLDHQPPLDRLTNRQIDDRRPVLPDPSCRPARRAAVAAGHASHAAAGRRRVTCVRDEVKIITRGAHIAHAEDDHRATHARQQQRGSTPRAVGTRAQPWRRPAGRHHRAGGHQTPPARPRRGQNIYWFFAFWAAGMRRTKNARITAAVGIAARMPAATLLPIIAR